MYSFHYKTKGYLHQRKKIQKDIRGNVKSVKKRIQINNEDSLLGSFPLPFINPLADSMAAKQAL